MANLSDTQNITDQQEQQKAKAAEEKKQAVGNNQPPKVDPAHAREDVRGNAQAEKPKPQAEPRPADRFINRDPEVAAKANAPKEPPKPEPPPKPREEEATRMEHKVTPQPAPTMRMDGVTYVNKRVQQPPQQATAQEKPQAPKAEPEKPAEKPKLPEDRPIATLTRKLEFYSDKHPKQGNTIKH